MSLHPLIHGKALPSALRQQVDGPFYFALNSCRLVLRYTSITGISRYWNIDEWHFQPDSPRARIADGLCTISHRATTADPLAKLSLTFFASHLQKETSASWKT